MMRRELVLHQLLRYWHAMRPLSLLVPIAATLCLPVLAGETPWQNLAPGVSIRLISAGTVDAGGKGLFALEIDMPETTKTYWRVPGEIGLPTELDFAASSGIADHVQHWPHPVRDEAGGYLDYVYYGHTVLPLELAIDDPAGMLDMVATLGVCSDICVPAQARLTLPLTDAEPDSANGLRIRQALADVPIEWDGDAEPIGTAHFLGDGSAIAVEIADASLDRDSLIAATAPGEPLFGAPQKSPQADLVVLPILGKTDNSALEGLEVEFTFLTDKGAFAVRRILQSGPGARVAEDR